MLNVGGNCRMDRSNSRSDVCEQRTKMTGVQSRLLKLLDRVFWGGITTDQGTVIETGWAGLSINWDNGHTTLIQRNDMAKVERVPVKNNVRA